MESDPKHVCVIGLNEFNLHQLRRIRGADAYRFRGIIDPAVVDTPASYPVRRVIEEATERVQALGAPVDAIVSYLDFPVSAVLPIIRDRFGLPGPSLESVLKCEHKYWSRLEQRRHVPEVVPRFTAFDPHEDDPLERIDLDFPFWVKPVKSQGSYLGFLARDPETFRRGLAHVRANIHKLAAPFDYVCSHAEMAPELEGVHAGHCLAEEIISSDQQCTLEGYVVDGEVVTYGVVDSIRAPGLSSFSRYQYPSRLPERVTRRMVDVARRVLEGIGFDGSPFNMEFFYDAERDREWLLEINPRISESHCPLFEKVDGAPHHEVMVEVGLGRRPRYPMRAGPYPLAAKFMLRTFEDGVVRHVPTFADVERVREEVPDLLVQVGVEEGQRLADLPEQDSYSFELGRVWLGGEDEAEIEEKYETVRRLLPLDIERLPQPRRVSA